MVSELSVLMGRRIAKENGAVALRFASWMALAIVLLVIFTAVLILAGNITLFEDGSATLAGRSLGCLIRVWGCS
jgi:hypothetical protein